MLQRLYDISSLGYATPIQYINKCYHYDHIPYNHDISHTVFALHTYVTLQCCNTNSNSIYDTQNNLLSLEKYNILIYLTLNDLN